MTQAFLEIFSVMFEMRGSLRPYSPNLNSIERLWKVMNEHARNNKFFRTADEFRQSINDFFKTTLPKIADGLRSRINDNFQKLDYAF